MAEVTLENVVKKFDRVTVVQDVNLTVKDREFIVLVGPSGCGKSTTLRMVAGLEEITSGTIRIDNRVVNDVSPKDRDIAMVFQNYALYPHMSVYDNMAFGLKLRKFPKDEIRQRVHEAAEILGIRDLLQRKPRALSGGQRQRVAVGRAIVRKPRVFLFDEPLSNLDAQLRVAMRAELKKLHERLKATVIYVTHDQVEAMTMGERIVIMKDGIIQQVGSPLEVYAHPENLFVAGFIGSPAMNFIECNVAQVDGRLSFAHSGFTLPVPSALADVLAAYVDRPVIMGCRPEDIHEASPKDSAHGTVDALVEVVEPVGHEIYLVVKAGPAEITARVSPDTPVKAGHTIRLSVTTEKLHAFDPQTEKAIPLTRQPT
jgi:multiple sugar transport system ATP-binding protein